MRNRLLLVCLLMVMGGCISLGTDEDDQKDEYGHRQKPGLSAAHLIQADIYPELVVEVDYMQGYKPTNRALDSLEKFLNRYLDKARITILQPKEIHTGNKNSYSADDIRELEKNHRDHYSQFDVITVYMIFVDGRYVQENVLGTAYYNTSTAFFGIALDDVTSGFGAPSRYLAEAVIMRHELGHLLGLVGIEGSGTDMQTAHRDGEHGNHCTVSTCLMYYAMQQPDLLRTLLGEEEIPSLDELCIQDLEAHREN